MGSDSAERCLMWFTVSSVGKKTVCLAPVDLCHLHRGLICILVRCAGMLLLLLAALYFPHKTQSFKGFFNLFHAASSFAYSLCSSFCFPSPFSFWRSLSILVCLLFVSFVHLAFASHSSVCWIWSAEIYGEFGCSRKNNLLSAIIIGGISGAGQSAERDAHKNCIK